MTALDHLRAAASALWYAETGAILTAPQMLSRAIRALDDAAGELPPDLAARAAALSQRCVEAAEAMIPDAAGLYDEAVALSAAASRRIVLFDEEIAA